MGQPTSLLVSVTEFIGCRSTRGEVKHLSTLRKRNQIRDSLSSGERTGNSLKSLHVKDASRCVGMVVGLIGVACKALKS